MAKYDRIFFHSDGELPLTVLFLLTALVLLAQRATRHLLTLSMQYLLLLVGLFWLLTKNTNAYYYLLFVPFLIVVLVEIITAAAPRMTHWQRQVIIVALCLYPLGGVARSRYLLQLNQRELHIMTENALLASYMPLKGAKVIAPIDFFFGQMPHYQIRSLTYFQLIAPTQPPSLQEFFAQAAQDSVRYVICDYRTWNQVYHIPRAAPTRIGSYQRTFQNKWRGIYEYGPITNPATK